MKALAPLAGAERAEAMAFALVDTTWFPLRDATISALELHGADGVPEALYALLHSSDPVVRSRAVSGLAALPPKQTKDWLDNALKDEDTSVRAAAVEALAMFEFELIEDHLVDALASEDRPVRMAAVKVLENSRHENAMEMLIEATRNKDVQVSKGAVYALGEFNDPRVIGPVLEAVQNRDVQYEAIRALGNLGDVGDRRCLDALSGVLRSYVGRGVYDSTDFFVCESAFEALEKLLPKLSPDQAATERYHSDAKRDMKKLLKTKQRLFPKHDCPKCDGSGWIDELGKHVACWFCDGSGTDPRVD